jgi:hypothetical protein
VKNSCGTRSAVSLNVNGLAQNVVDFKGNTPQYQRRMLLLPDVEQRVQGPVTNLAREKRSRRRQAMPMKKKAAKKKKKH